MTEINESVVTPCIKEIRIHWGGDGKVALQSYGKESSGYGANISRTYEVPPHWTEEQVAAFEWATIAAIKATLEPVLQAEHEWRLNNREAFMLRAETELNES